MLQENPSLKNPGHPIESSSLAVERVADPFHLLATGIFTAKFWQKKGYSTPARKRIEAYDQVTQRDSGTNPTGECKKLEIKVEAWSMLSVLVYDAH